MSRIEPRPLPRPAAAYRACVSRCDRLRFSGLHVDQETINVATPYRDDSLLLQQRLEMMYDATFVGRDGRRFFVCDAFGQIEVTQSPKCHGLSIGAPHRGWIDLFGDIANEALCFFTGFIWRPR